jgi:hypothetical protein
LWHDLAHGTRKSWNIGESPETSKTLTRTADSEKANDSKGPTTASQAIDGGSMPLTCSTQFNCLLGVVPWRRDFLGRFWGADLSFNLIDGSIAAARIAIRVGALHHVIS